MIKENKILEEKFEKLKQEYNLVKKSMKILKDFCN